MKYQEKQQRTYGLEAFPSFVERTTLMVRGTYPLRVFCAYLFSDWTLRRRAAGAITDQACNQVVLPPPDRQPACTAAFLERGHLVAAS